MYKKVVRSVPIGGIRYHSAQVQLDAIHPQKTDVHLFLFLFFQTKKIFSLFFANFLYVEIFVSISIIGIFFVIVLVYHNIDNWVFNVM